MTGGDSNGLNMDKSTVYEKAVGKCPVVTVRLDGADVPCLLDSRSEVSTITEEFFKDHFRPLGKTILTYWRLVEINCSKWISNTIRWIPRTGR